VVEHVKDQDDSKISWIELTDDFYWSALCMGISYGKPGLKME
jgi:hypothetical protein